MATGDFCSSQAFTSVF